MNSTLDLDVRLNQVPFLNFGSPNRILFEETFLLLALFAPLMHRLLVLMFSLIFGVNEFLNLLGLL